MESCASKLWSSLAKNTEYPEEESCSAGAIGKLREKNPSLSSSESVNHTATTRNCVQHSGGRRGEQGEPCPRVPEEGPVWGPLTSLVPCGEVFRVALGMRNRTRTMTEHVISHRDTVCTILPSATCGESGHLKGRLFCRKSVKFWKVRPRSSVSWELSRVLNPDIKEYLSTRIHHEMTE